jgi:hypothetical protein
MLSTNRFLATSAANLKRAKLDDFVASSAEIFTFKNFLLHLGQAYMINSIALPLKLLQDIAKKEDQEDFDSDSLISEAFAASISNPEKIFYLFVQGVHRQYFKKIFECHVLRPYLDDDGQLDKYVKNMSNSMKRKGLRNLHGYSSFFKPFLTNLKGNITGS